jgi:hypothetical protein
MRKVEETKSAKMIASFFFLPLFEEEEELVGDLFLADAQSSSLQNKKTQMIN